MSGFVELLPGLNGGLIVFPEDVFALVLGLERRGLTLRVDGERLKIAAPGGGKPEFLTGEADQIRLRKAHIMALVSYQPPERKDL